MNVKISKEKQLFSTSLVLLDIRSDHESKLSQLAEDYGLNSQALIHDFKGDLGEIWTTYFDAGNDSGKLILIGMGSMGDKTKWTTTLTSTFKKLRDKLDNTNALVFQYLDPDLVESATIASTKAAVYADYDLGLYKTDKKEIQLKELAIVQGEGGFENVVEETLKLANTQLRVRDIVNAPANKLTPKMLAEWVKDSASKYGYSVNIFELDQIKKHGFNALLAVNQGSNQPPTFTVAEYHHPEAKSTVGLVGKGVTFDTGGVSIKPSDNMHYMKSDMGGAAAVLGSIEVVSRLKLPINLIVVVPATENSIGTNAVKPGDIIHSHSGKTIEVIDTDAEGRLILADALSYITSEYETDYLIDFATLTGSVVRALGYHAAGLFTSDNESQSKLLEAADICNEKIWPFPMWKDYEEDLESDVADVKNFSGKPVAGAISAAKFLEVFTREHPHWSHLDIAGTAFGDTQFGKQKNATAFGIELMLTFLKNLIHK